MDRKERSASYERGPDVEALCHKSGTPQSGQKWSAVAENLNTHPDFAEMPRDQRSV